MRKETPLGRVDEVTPLLRQAHEHTSYDSNDSTAVASSSSSTLDTETDVDNNESTENDAKRETPLDWWQFSLILFLQLAESLTSQVIYPFVPQVSRDQSSSFRRGGGSTRD